MSKSNCEPALLSSLETLQHNLQDAGMLRMKASLYSEAAVREALGDSEYRRISEKLDRRALLAQLDAVSLLFALSNVLQLFLVGGCWAAPSGHDVRFEDAAGRWVYEGQLRADTVRHGVIPDRSNHQERHEILRVESFDGDVKAVQSFLNEHDAGYIAEVTPEQPIIVEALGNKACVYVTKIVQCELRDVLRLLEAK